MYPGVFTVSGILDSFIYHGQKAIKKKMELGKFSWLVVLLLCVAYHDEIALGKGDKKIGPAVTRFNYNSCITVAFLERIWSDLSSFLYHILVDVTSVFLQVMLQEIKCKEGGLFGGTEFVHFSDKIKNCTWRILRNLTRPVETFPLLFCPSCETDQRPGVGNGVEEPNENWILHLPFNISSFFFVFVRVFSLSVMHSSNTLKGCHD